MTPKQQKLFKELHEKRKIQAKMLDDFAMRGIKQSVVDMYNQKAHFIYELLQNADDTKATQVTFELFYDKLIFRHNGKIRFSISEEKEDTIPYGHINAITAIGFSSKKGEEGNKIGKFGIGFKAIYQYSDCPEIYDDKFCFTIQNFVVPTLLAHDYPDRKSRETLFVFPFNEPAKAYQDIKNKLQALDFPILFLQNLKKVVISGTGLPATQYTKSIKYRNESNGIIHEWIEMNNHNERTSVHLFSKPLSINDKNHPNFFISTGYLLTKEGNLDIDARHPIYCFFPTSEHFDDLCCLCHAPFELVNSRQQLKETSYNQFLIHELAKLAADALPIIRDYYWQKKRTIFNDNVIRMIPKERFRTPKRNDIFRSFYIQILQQQALLLTQSKTYTLPQTAFLVQKQALQNLVSNEQFKLLLNKEAQFLHSSFRDAVDKDKDLFTILVNYLHINIWNAESFLHAITPKFMQHQEYSWVKKLYYYLHRNEHTTWEYDNKENAWNYAACSAPIIKTTKGQWVSAYTKEGNPNVFLPLTETKSKSTYQLIHADYLVEDTPRNFFRALRITTPSTWNYISSVILKQCREKTVSVTDLPRYFEIIYSYFQEITARLQQEKLAEIHKSFALLVGKKRYQLIQEEVYYDSPELKVYGKLLEGKKIQSDQYISFRQLHGEKAFIDFLHQLGVHFYPVVSKETTIFKRSNITPSWKKTFALNLFTQATIIDYTFPHIDFLIKAKNKSVNKSIALWNWLSQNDLSTCRYATCTYRYHVEKQANPCDSSLFKILTETKWLHLNDGKWYKPAEVYWEDLEESGYAYAANLIEFIDIQRRERNLKELGLTDEEVRRNDLGRIFEHSGLSLEEMKAAIAWMKKEKTNKELYNEKESLKKTYNESNDKALVPTNAVNKSLEYKTALEKKREEWEKLQKTNVQRPSSIQSPNATESRFKPLDEFNCSTDSSDVNTYHVSTLKSTPKDKKRQALEKFSRQTSEANLAAEKAAETNELFTLFNECTPYSFLWFKLLMDLQFTNKSKIVASESTFSFLKYEWIPEENRIILMNPTKTLPTWLADATDMKLAFNHTLCAQTKVSLVKLEEGKGDFILNDKPKNIFKEDISRIQLIVQHQNSNPIDSLRKRFLQLALPDDFNLAEQLKQSIQFIYGPPGTGKTTLLVSKLAERVKVSIDSLNILILTPTNKAADVIATKLFDNTLCKPHLTRLGTTESQDLLDKGVVQTRDSFFIDKRKKNLVVTTVARYSYDCLQPNDCAICDFNWDFIVVDEASMVNLVSMAFILYKGINSHFIIAGDPKQIEPVTENEMPNYNIYDMVGLDSFKNAIETYKRFPIEALSIQFRSVSAIGTLVSKFAYDGMVRNYPKRTKQKPLIIDGLEVDSLNIVHFRSDDWNPLYQYTEINKSPLHPYSAILTYNFVRYLSKQIKMRYPKKMYSIGIITPYGAQANAIAQMETYQPMSTSNCKVITGTVHRFQGDECDIMILLMNPPLQAGEYSHINNEHIWNVAMSRARDYLFFFMPNSDNGRITLKQRIYNLVNKDENEIIKDTDLEKVIFGNPNYIAQHTNITCHLPINVYSESTSEYEIRLSDTALDIQMHQNLSKR